MAIQYFFAHGETRHGPYSARELLHLATAGEIAPTDPVWRLGIGQAIPAARVKNLFQVTAPGLLAIAAPVAPDATVAPADVGDPPSVPVEAAAAAANSAIVPMAERPGNKALEQQRPRRVVSIKGGVLVGQDGKQVHFRKKCPTCGTEEQCRSTAVIRPGAMKVSYYCRKCRKGRTVEMVGLTC